MEKTEAGLQWPLFLRNRIKVLLYLTRSANLPEGIYILPILFIYFFNGRHSRPGVSEPNGPILTKISGLVDGCKGLFTSLSFFDFSRDVAMATN